MSSPIWLLLQILRHDVFAPLRESRRSKAAVSDIRKQAKFSLMQSEIEERPH
jgi:hypothetical protein